MTKVRPRKRRSLVGLGVCFLVIVCCIRVSDVMGGPISDAIEESCPEQFDAYEATVRQYAIRMKRAVESYGCGVVSAYGVFADRDMDRLEAWEDDPGAFSVVHHIFLLAKQYRLDISRHPLVFDIIFTFVQVGDEEAFSRLDDILSHLSRREKAAIRHNPQLIFYLFWATRLQAKADWQVQLRAYDELTKQIEISFLPMAVMMDAQIRIAYPSLSPSERLSQITSTMDAFPRDVLEQIMGNPRARESLIFLLPPQYQDVPEVQNLTDDGLMRLRGDYVRVVRRVLELFTVRLGGHIGVAMDSVEVLSPHILHALSQGIRAGQITNYLEAQIQSTVFREWLGKESDCKGDQFKDILAQFFSFLAPHHLQGKTFEPIPRLQGNLTRIARWYRDSRDDALRNFVAHSNHPERFIQSMAWMPYYREALEGKGPEVLSRLLTDLPDAEMVQKAEFAKLLKDNTDYFKWAQWAPDATTFVTSRLGSQEKSGPKFLYVLTTPYPSQSASSLWSMYLDDRKVPKNGDIQALTQYSVSELETHEFTTSEKLSTYVEAADNAFMVISIASIPFTGGATGVFVASRLAAKQAIKKGVKHGLKRAAKRGAKRGMGRLLKKKSKDWVKKQGLKMRLAPKLGKTRKFLDPADKIINSTSAQIATVAVSMTPLAIAMYCAKYGESTNIASPLCHRSTEEESHDPCAAISTP